VTSVDGRESDFDGAGNRLLKRVDLLEASIAPIPMNSAAMVTGVKRRATRGESELAALKARVLRKRLERLWRPADRLMDGYGPRQAEMTGGFSDVYEGPPDYVALTLFLELSR